jgi:arylsulfatase A-like enzyme
MPIHRLTFLFLLLTALTTRAAEQPLNVLIIQTDEHNFRTLGCYRKLMSEEQAYVWGPSVKVETPNIDWIANNGAICTSYYATSPVCTPSRAALVSGRYPHNTGSPQNNSPLLDDVVTFAEVLKRQGYATGYAGKWHLDGPAKPGWAPQRKFGFEDNRYLFNRGHWKKLGEDKDGPKVAATDKQGKPSYSLDGADEKSFTTDFLADRTIDFIRANKDKPFCYMVAIPDPHGPNTVRPPYDTMFDEMKFQQPPSALAKGKGLPSFSDIVKARFNARQMALYFGMVKCIDDNIGKILEELRGLDLIDKTLIVFTSDHGDMCGELGRHNKGIPCEGSARIPFVIRAPGVIPEGHVIDHALGTVDFKPTLLGLLDVEIDAPAEGIDASAIFKKETPSDPDAITYVRIDSTQKGWLGAFTSRYKLVASPTDPLAFFDLKEDPNELQNLLAEPGYRDEIRRLASGLKNYGETYADPMSVSATIQADLAWAMSDSDAYRPTPRSGGKKAEKK